MENSDDPRNSLSITLINRLEELGADVVLHDPWWVYEYQGDLAECVRNCDATVVMVAHDEYRATDLSKLRARVAHHILVDGRKVFSAEQVWQAGWVYRGVGRGM